MKEEYFVEKEYHIESATFVVQVDGVRAEIDVPRVKFPAKLYMETLVEARDSPDPFSIVRTATAAGVVMRTDAMVSEPDHDGTFYKVTILDEENNDS